MRGTSNRTRNQTTTLVTSVAVAATLLLAACGGDDTAESVAEPVAEAATDESASAAAATSPDYGLVTPQEAAQLAASGVTVLDVRTPEEFAEGHIDGAQLVDFYSDTFADQIATLDPEQEYLVYCRSGNRSGQTIELMRDLGFDRVWDLDGGVIAYGDAGLPLVR